MPQYNIDGAHRETGAAVRIHVHAADRDAAMREAIARGLIVHSIQVPPLLPLPPPPKYPALRVVAGIYEVLAWLLPLLWLVLALVAALSAAGGAPPERLAFAIQALLGAFASWIVPMSISQGIRLMLDIEEHLRAQIELMRERRA